MNATVLCSGDTKCKLRRHTITKFGRSVTIEIMTEDSRTCSIVVEYKILNGRDKISFLTKKKKKTYTMLLKPLPHIQDSRHDSASNCIFGAVVIFGHDYWSVTTASQETYGCYNNITTAL